MKTCNIESIVGTEKILYDFFSVPIIKIPTQTELRKQARREPEATHYTDEQLYETRRLLIDFNCMSWYEGRDWYPPEYIKTTMQLYNLRDRMIKKRLFGCSC